jgi:formylglycine-generating enzyme required for sulfatase activity
MRAGAVLLLLALTTLSTAAVAQGKASVRELRDCADCPVLVRIEPGSYERGSTAAEALAEQTPERDAANERPYHRVTIAYAFAVAKYEVTRADFARFAAATRLPASKDCLGWDRANARWGRYPGERDWRSPGFEQADNHPVVCVNWPEAKAYADWMAARTGKPYRLLTDAEWEYVVRAGSTAQRWFGMQRSDICRHANVSDLDKAAALRQPAASSQVFPCRDGFVFTAPVGRFAPNPWGVHDLFGNAWEWTEDCFARSYEGAPRDGSARQPAAGAACAERVMRGGAWHADPFYLRAAKHDFAPPLLRSARMGLRLARKL